MAKGKKAVPDTSDVTLALHLNGACDASCGYCIIDRAAEILAESRRHERASDGR